MTDGGIKVMMARIREWLWNFNGALAIASIVVLVVGIFVLGSPVGRIICGLIDVGIAAYFIVPWLRVRLEQRDSRESDNTSGEELYSQHSKGTMKKLLFDDYQPTAGKYVVKEVSEEPKVVLSTRTVQPVAVRPEPVHEMEILDFFDLDSDASLSDV